MESNGKTRLARMAAMDVGEGDTISHDPRQGGGLVGVVITRRGTISGGISYLVRTPAGEVTDWPSTGRPGISAERAVWIVVPRACA